MHTNHQYSLSIWICVIASLVLSSCALNEPAPQRSDNIMDSDKFVIYDGSLGDRIKINSIAKRSVGNLMTAQVEIQNTWFGDLKIEYRYAWYDADGFELEPDARAWQPLLMPANGIQTLKTTAPSSAASDFKVFIKES